MIQVIKQIGINTLNFKMYSQHCLIVFFDSFTEPACISIFCYFILIIILFINNKLLT